MDQKEVTESPCDINYDGDCALCDDKAVEKYKSALNALTEEAYINEKNQYNDHIQKLNEYLLTLKPTDKEYTYTAWKIDSYTHAINDLTPYIQCNGLCMNANGLKQCNRNAYYDVRENKAVLVNEIILEPRDEEGILRRKYCYQHAIANTNPCNSDNNYYCHLCNDSILTDYKDNLERTSREAIDKIKKKYINDIENMEKQLRNLSPMINVAEYDNLKRKITEYKKTFSDTEPYIQCVGTCGSTTASLRCKRNARYAVLGGGDILLVTKIGNIMLRRTYCLQHARVKANKQRALYSTFRQ